MPDGTWCEDVEQFSTEWHRFGDVVCDQFGGRISSFGSGLSVGFDDVRRSIYLEIPVARVIYRLATGKDYLPVGKNQKEKAA